LTILIAAVFSVGQKVYSDHDPGVVAPQVIEKTGSEYTEEARLARLEGAVVVSCIVNEDASLRDVYVARSLGLGLDEKAIEAIRQWKFAPGTKDGQPVPVLTRADVTFRMLIQRSDWHLSRADFEVPKGGSRPVVVHAQFPGSIGEGMAKGAVSFDVDERGDPVNILVEFVSDARWDLAAAMRGWRFQPGWLDGKPVRVHGTFGFAGGQITPSVSPHGASR
jgi:TonB family protein